MNYHQVSPKIRQVSLSSRREVREKRRRMDASLELCSCKPRNVWSQWKLAEPRKDSPLEPWRKCGPPNSLILHFWSPELCEKTFLLF